MPGLNFKGTNKYQKIAETMLKKTHFTESEIDRLSDLHNDIIVCKIDIIDISVTGGIISISIIVEKQQLPRQDWPEEVPGVPAREPRDDGGRDHGQD